MKVLQAIAAGLAALVLGPARPALAQEALTVLSYNVCWQCMSQRRYGLQGQCLDKTVTHAGVSVQTTSCAEAMGKGIDSYATRYDFVGLQEASNWQDFAVLAPGTLGAMTGIEGRSGPEYMVSYYDPARFTHQFRQIEGDIGSGRPIMINLFTDTKGQGYTFVNIHNCHAGCGFPALEQAIDAAVRKDLDGSGGAYAEISQFIAGSRIIVTGDFNEASYTETGKGTVAWQPFRDVSIGTSTSVRDAPTTCCSTVVPWDCGTTGVVSYGCRPGDYVFDSATVAQPKVPDGYDDAVPQSDHKPVIAVLQ